MSVSLRIVKLMTDNKSKLVILVNKENVSAIRIMGDILEISPEEVIKLIEDLCATGTIHGSITDDGERFYKSEIKLSDAPVIPGGDQIPAFMKFDTRPGIISSIIGFAIIALGLFLNANALDFVEQDFGAITMFLGVFILFSGMYCLSRRKTPE